ncbi:MAG: kinase [Chthoniobacterales bacterium]
MVISRTPYRISLLGGGTDYPDWYSQHGGAVLAASINRYCYLTCRYLPPFFEHRFRIVYSVTEDCREISDISHPVVKAALETFAFDNGLEIHHDGDLPAHSGIGSSSSFTVGILHALFALKGQMVSKYELARLAIQIEQKQLRENVGCQDQIMAAYGGFNHIEFQKSGEFLIHPLTLPDYEAVSSHCLLIFTGIRRLSSDIAATYVHNFDARIEQMTRVQKSVNEGKELLLSGGRMREFGELVHETWLAKKSLSSAVSRPEIDEIYDAARQAGAVGGKILGSGGGGFMLLIVPPERQKAVRERLRHLICVPLSFENAGSQIIFYEPEQIENPI